MRLQTAMAAAIIGAVAGCGRKPAEPEGPWKPLEAGELTPEAEKLAKLAADARDSLATSLLAELTSAIDSGGTASAIKVCKERAPAIAAEVSSRMGVKIGRTSFRLRNPSNAPPAWTAKLVEERRSDPVLVDLKGRGLGVLLPIRLAAPCLNCHGDKEKIAPDVAQALAAAYPSDQATGFQLGDLRGWFWVEVPRGAGAR